MFRISLIHNYYINTIYHYIIFFKIALHYELLEGIIPRSICIKFTLEILLSAHAVPGMTIDTSEIAVVFMNLTH